MLQEQLHDLANGKRMDIRYALPHSAGEGVLEVLERAAADYAFIAELTHRGPEALEGYDLTPAEQAALLSGDIRWIEAHVGKLPPRQRTWLYCRLEQEIW